MLTESRQVATPSISSSLSRSCWIAVPSRASRPCNSKLFSCNSDHQNFSFAQKKSIEGEMFSPPGGGDQKQIPRQRCSPTASTSSPRAFWVVFEFDVQVNQQFSNLPDKSSEVVLEVLVLHGQLLQLPPGREQGRFCLKPCVACQFHLERKNNWKYWKSSTLNILNFWNILSRGVNTILVVSNIITKATWVARSVAWCSSLSTSPWLVSNCSRNLMTMMKMLMTTTITMPTTMPTTMPMTMTMTN